MKIGIIGLGFVGKAVSNSYDDWMTIKYIIDIDPEKNNATYEELGVTDAVFVCVPSPSKEDGSCDTSILQEVLYNLRGYTGPIISKVTAPPQTYRELGKMYPNLVYSPEFLTAANASLDYLQSTFIVVGGTVMAYQREAARIINLSLKLNDNVHYCSLDEASMMKYVINCFLATKVSFMNEIYQVAQHNDIDFYNVVKLAKLDSRIGKSHMSVPGPDGHFGFGGMCFPKDTKALINFARTDMPILGKVIEENDRIRGS
jgi:UDPglucose 6-dehydrogenase